MSGDSLRVMMVRGFSTCTSVLNGGSSSIEFQPSSKTCRVTGSNRPVGLIPAERPRLRSGRTRTPLCSIIAFAISALPLPKAAMSARTICSILARSQGLSAGLRIAVLMKLFLFCSMRTKQELFAMIAGGASSAGAYAGVSPAECDRRHFWSDRARRSRAALRAGRHRPCPAGRAGHGAGARLLPGGDRLHAAKKDIRNGAWRSCAPVPR